MILGAQAVKDGKADAVLSAGNTGALLAAGLFVVGRIKNIDRPGLMSTLPTVNGQDLTCLIWELMLKIRPAICISMLFWVLLCSKCPRYCSTAYWSAQ